MVDAHRLIKNGRLLFLKYSKFSAVCVVIGIVFAALKTPLKSAFTMYKISGYEIQ